MVKHGLTVCGGPALVCLGRSRLSGVRPGRTILPTWVVHHAVTHPHSGRRGVDPHLRRDTVIVLIEGVSGRLVGPAAFKAVEAS